MDVGVWLDNVLERGIKKQIWPPSNHNPSFKLELPAIATDTEANAIVLLELLSKP